jgi:hypothetical protein
MYIIVEVSFSMIAVISFAVEITFAWYGISMFFSFRQLLDHNLLLNIRIGKNGSTVITKVISVTVVCVIVLSLRIANYIYQVQYWINHQTGGHQVNFLEGQYGYVHSLFSCITII